MNGCISSEIMKKVLTLTSSQRNHFNVITHYSPLLYLSISLPARRPLELPFHRYSPCIQFICIFRKPCYLPNSTHSLSRIVLLTPRLACIYWTDMFGSSMSHKRAARYRLSKILIPLYGCEGSTYGKVR